MEITDTTKEPNPEWLFGDNPFAIGMQEKKGQSELSLSSQLPKEFCDYDNTELRDAFKLYTKLGFKPTKTDDSLFYKIIFPDSNWKIKPTEHSMWSELYEGDNKIAEIFYKAAFYDRRAFIRFKYNGFNNKETSK